MTEDDTLTADSEGTCKNPDVLLESVQKVSIGKITEYNLQRSYKGIIIQICLICTIK